MQSKAKRKFNQEENLAKRNFSKEKEKGEKTMLGIIGAMAEEVEQLKQDMACPEVTKIAGMEFYKGRIGEKMTVVVRSGIGKVNAGVCVQILVDRFGVDGIVNTGIAGSLHAEINIEIWYYPQMQSSMMSMRQHLDTRWERSRRWMYRHFRQMRSSVHSQRNVAIK